MYRGFTPPTPPASRWINSSSTPITLLGQEPFLELPEDLVVVQGAAGPSEDQAIGVSEGTTVTEPRESFHHLLADGLFALPSFVFRWAKLAAIVRAPHPHRASFQGRAVHHGVMVGEVYILPDRKSVV